MKFFSIDELCKSSTATKYGIKNVPSVAEKKHIVELIENLLDPIREQWAEYCKKKEYGTGALKVTSGFRNQKVNKLVGGVKTSAHLTGYAADIKPLNGYMTKFEEWISTEFVKSGIKFDQIIKERSKTSRWVHVGYKNLYGHQRMQTFTLVVK